MQISGGNTQERKKMGKTVGVDQTIDKRVKDSEAARVCDGV
jgi:hypothetical protein